MVQSQLQCTLDIPPLHRSPIPSQDFLEMLPLPFYTHPKEAPLNLASAMPAWSNPTDLGPKTYVAFGRVGDVQV
jgi:hypothetical protein